MSQSIMFDYDSLATLLAVVRTGGFDSAARQLGITQSAVSQRIKQLEEKVGLILIVRGRPCVPTEAGLQLCRHIEQVELLQHETEKQIATLSGGEANSAATVRISVNNDSLATWFPSVIKRASDELGVLFNILPDDQEHTERALTTGDALAVVTAMEKPVEGCTRISLGSMEYVAVASKAFHDQHFASGVTPDALRRANCLAFDEKDTIQSQWMLLAFGEEFPVPTILVPSYEGYVACCVNGSAWGLVPSDAAAPLIRQGKFVELTPGKSVKVPLHWQARAKGSEILRRLGSVVLEQARIHLLPDNFRTD